MRMQRNEWQRYNRSLATHGVHSKAALDKLEDQDAVKDLSPIEPLRSVAHPRNKPCPCGSGSKYKFCCGAKEVQELIDARLQQRDKLADETKTYVVQANDGEAMAQEACDLDSLMGGKDEPTQLQVA